MLCKYSSSIYSIISSFTLPIFARKLTRGAEYVLKESSRQYCLSSKIFPPILSCLPALNLRFTNYNFFDPYYDKTYEQIEVPADLTQSPEDTILNYFSILREAENTEGRSCGTIGEAHIPYPLAYNFLSKVYQKRLSYEEYVHLFAGVGHIS